MYRISDQEFSIKCIWKFVSFDKNPLLRGWKLLQFKWQLKWGTETKQQRSTNDIDTYGAQLVPLNFSHQVSFTRRQFSLARFFFRHDSLFFATTFFGTTFFSARLFFGTTVFFWHDFFFGHDFLFSAQPGQVTADQYYCSGMEHMVNSTVVQILGTRYYGAQFNSAT